MRTLIGAEYLNDAMLLFFEKDVTNEVSNAEIMQ